MHGYARESDCARLVNLYHAQCVALQCVVWSEWVPSKGNVGDVPTRPERLAELEKHRPAARFVPMRLPIASEMEGAITDWIWCVRARCVS